MYPAGIVRGCGRQTSAACLNLLTFWGVGLPLAAGLAFPHDQRLGITGLWIGMCTVVYVQCIAMRILIWRFDWHQESLRAAKLVSSNSSEKSAYQPSPDIEAM